MASTPRVGKFPQTTTVAWSDGTKFTGFAYIGLIDPTYGTSDDATSTDWLMFYPQIKVPDRAIIPIVEGKYNNSLGLYYNADLTPPNSTYKMILYDSTKRAVTALSAAFSVTADPISTLPAPTPTAPTAGSSFPAADT